MRGEYAGQLVWFEEALIVVGVLRRDLKDALRQPHEQQTRLPGAVDRVVDEAAIRPQHARHFRDHLLDALDMFQHIGGDDGIERGVREGQPFRYGAGVANGEAAFARVRARHPKGGYGAVDAGDGRASAGVLFRHEPAAAAELQDALTGKVAEHVAEVGDAGRVDLVQRRDDAFGVPPGVSEFVVPLVIDWHGG